MPRVLTLLMVFALAATALAEEPVARAGDERRTAIRAELEALAASDELSRGFNLIHELVGPSVASIHINQSLLRLNRASGSVEKREIEVGEGSGFIFAADSEYSWLLTNAHVVLQTNRSQDFIRDEADRPVWYSTIRVGLHDGRMVEAEPVGADPKSDLAVLRVPVGDLPTITWGDPDQMQVGAWVLALGYPLGVGYSASAGIISAKARSTGIYRSEGGYESFLQTDAAINPGNSGGPMVNLRGQVVGVNANIISRTGASIGLGFAIPANLARRVAEDLMDDGQITRPLIGVQMAEVDPDDIERLGVPNRHAVLLQRVMPASPADLAGIEAGDLVLGVDGRPVQSIDQFRTRIAAAEIGQPLTFELWREGAHIELQVEPVSWQDYTATARELAADGAVVRWPTYGMGLRNDELRGVLIDSVDQGSIAEQAGLRAGDRILRIANVGAVEEVSGLDVLDRQPELTMEVYKGRRLLLVRLRAR